MSEKSHKSKSIYRRELTGSDAPERRPDYLKIIRQHMRNRDFANAVTIDTLYARGGERTVGAYLVATGRVWR
jgi:hypothetical protein